MNSTLLMHFVDRVQNQLPMDLRTTISSSSGGGGVVEVDDGRLEFVQQQLTLTRIAIQRVAMIIVVVFGIVGNALNIAVLTRRWMKSSTNFYLTALAVYDTLYLVLALTLTWTHYDGIKSTSWYVRYKDPFGRPLTDTCSNTGVWLTLTFTVERYIGVCYPMKGKVWCTPQRAKYIIAAVCLLAGILTFPEFFEFSSVEEFDVKLNATVTRRKQTDFGQRPSYSIGYTYANQIMFTFLPLILLLTFNCLLIRAVVHAAQQRKTMTKPTLVFVSDDPVSCATTNVGRMVTGRLGGSTLALDDRGRRRCNGGGCASGFGGGGEHKNQKKHDHQQRITIMLISVVIVFIICQLPQAVQKLYTVYVIETETATPVIRTTLAITANYFNLLVVINCSVNFALYSSFSTKFRMTFRRLLLANCCCRRVARRRQAAAGGDHLGLCSTVDMTSTTCGGAAGTMHMCVMDERRTSYTNFVHADDVSDISNTSGGGSGGGDCTATTCVATGGAGGGGGGGEKPSLASAQTGSHASRSAASRGTTEGRIEQRARLLNVPTKTTTASAHRMYRGTARDFS